MHTKTHKRRANTEKQVVTDSQGRKWEIFKAVLHYEEPMRWMSRPAGSSAQFKIGSKTRSATLLLLSTFAEKEIKTIWGLI